METKQDRLQRITLDVQGLRMPLSVQPDAEPQYRVAAAELNRLVDSYRNKYPDHKRMPADAYITMAAIDRAYHTILLRQEADKSCLSDMVKDMNKKIEDLLAQNG